MISNITCSHITSNRATSAIYDWLSSSSSKLAKSNPGKLLPQRNSVPEDVWNPSSHARANQSCGPVRTISPPAVHHSCIITCHIVAEATLNKPEAPHAAWRPRDETIWSADHGTHGQA